MIETPPRDVQDEDAAKSTLPIFEILGASVSNEVANIKDERTKPTVWRVIDGYTVGLPLEPSKANPNPPRVKPEECTHPESHMG